MDTSGFRPELYLVEEEYEEVPLRDRKRKIPNWLERSERREFICDVVSLANTARLFGRPAYLLYGIDEDCEICGVGMPAGKEATPLTLHDWEDQRRSIGQTVAQYITPKLPALELKHGELGDRQLCYLMIHPLPTEAPFQVRKEYHCEGKQPLRVGDCWIRYGESKQQVRRMDISGAPYCHSYAETPYVLPSSWARYFDNLLSESQLVAAGRVAAYQELWTRGGQRLRAVVDRFLTRPNSRLLVIRGMAGSGKTAFLGRLVLQWAEAGRVAMNARVEREEFAGPPEWVPIYLPLRGERFAGIEHFTSELLDRMNQSARLWYHRPSGPEGLLESAQLHWLICLDGLDEMADSQAQRVFAQMLPSFLRRFPRAKTIITARPDVAGLGHLGSTVEVDALSEEQIAAYMANYFNEYSSDRRGDRDDVELGRSLQFLRSERDLWRLCSVPLYLSAVVEQIAGVDTRREDDFIASSALASREITTLSVASGITEPARERGEHQWDPLIIDETALILEAPITDTPTQFEETPAEADGKDGPARIYLGRLLDDVYRSLWKREAARMLLPPAAAEKWWGGVGELAITMDGLRGSEPDRTVIHYVGCEEALRWLLGLGVLERKSLGGWLAFATALTKLYFAASFLRPYVEERVCQEARQYLADCSDDFRTKLYGILGQITYSDVESLLAEVNRETTRQ